MAGSAATQMNEIPVLLIADDEVAATRVARLLGECPAITLVKSSTRDVDAALQRPIDAIVVAVPPQPETAVGLIGRVVRLATATPVFVVLSEGQPNAMQLAAMGAQACVDARDSSLLLLPELLASVVDRRRLTARCHKLAQRRTEIEGLLSAVLDLVGTETVIVGGDGGLIAVNPAFSAGSGWQLREVAARPLASILTEQADGTGRLRHKDGRVLPVAIRSATLGVDGREFRVVTFEGAALVPSLPSVEAAFAARISALVGQGGGKLVAGRLQVVSLEEVRATLGERWERMAERVYGTAEAILRKRLAAEDVFTRNDAGHFVLCFAQLNEAEAWFKAQAIQKEIRERLLGETSLAGLTAVTVETHEIELSAQDAAETTTTGLVDIIATRLAVQADQMRKDAERFIVEAFASCELRPRPVFTPAGRPAGLDIAEFDPATQARLEQIAAMDEDWKLLAQIDAMTVGSAAQHIFKHLSVRGGRLLLVPLAFSTLYYRQHREKLLSICRQLPAPVRHCLILSVRGIPDGILPARVTELLNSLRPFARQRMVQLDRAQLGTLDLRDAMVSLVGIDAMTLATASEQDPAAVQALRGALQHAGARLLIDGIDSKAGLAVARQAGADLIAQPRVTEAPARRDSAA